MKNANTECQQLLVRWKSLEQNRPTEMDFTPFGYPAVKVAIFTMYLFAGQKPLRPPSARPSRTTKTKTKLQMRCLHDYFAT